MSEEDLTREAHKLDFQSKYRFLVFIAIAVALAAFLVSVALALYNSSGAAQLDLSRPGYQSVREQAPRSTTYEGFPASGTLDTESLVEFRKLYKEKSKEAQAIDSFSGDVISDKALSINPTQ